MKEDEECNTWIDDYSAQGDGKENNSVREDHRSMCKDVVIKMELMQLQVEIDSYEDMKLQSEFQHALDVLNDEHKKLKLSFQSIFLYLCYWIYVNVNFIKYAY